MPEQPPPVPPQAAMERPSALAPLRVPVFRMLWLTWLAANTTMWMNDVAAAWLMTSLAPSPLWVALVQSASTLPVFLLGLPSGALADILDRKRYFMITQFWVAAIAIVLCAVVALDWINAPLLLALTFANGVGLAMRWPVFAAIVPELVSRQQLPAALALNGVAMNFSRILGPLVAGALIASAGSAWVFLLNAVLSLAAGFTIMRWRREHKESPLGRERLASAMRVGVQYVWQSGRIRAILLRISLFFLHSTALLALLPLVARALPGGAAGTFTVLLASMGAGAVFAALQMQRLRQFVQPSQLVLGGTIVQACAAVVVAFATSLYLAVPGMLVAGAAWITVANSLTVSTQMALPDWVRARGMSIYQMALMGSTAAGAALWGQVATWTGIHDALLLASVSSITLMTLAHRFVADRGTEEDLTPSSAWKAPQAESPPRQGRIVVNIEYRIDPERVEEFMQLMQESRRSRMSQGALDWQVLRDVYDPGRVIEQITDESWTEHLRRFDRVTATDVQLRDRRLSFHLGDEPPVVTRYLVEK
ncbi:MFS transporter [Ramlibacter solisilvae]|uniref:Arabinose ABC transporter permease n=1 Tax=Ramlibacter tataouinensis TaxID=94132 RepID=A0A127JVU2_9BURK|nr:MFS transporter [Ramlibacter tataouinensis]AMO24025.1 arabinose ABC transporter permease [Ramlibacter tataouinensis]